MLWLGLWVGGRTWDASTRPSTHNLPPQAIGFALVPFMPSVASLTALFFCVCFSYNFTNRCVICVLL